MSKLRFTKFRLFPENYGLFPAVFLVYFSLPIYYLYGETMWKQAIGYFLLVYFIWSYRQLFFTQSMVRFQQMIGSQLAIILLYCIFYGPYYIFLGFFTATCLGWCKEQVIFRNIYPIFMVIITLSSIINVALADQFSSVLFTIPVAIVMMLSPFSVRSMIAKAELEKQLDSANEQIAELIKREERLRISRDLHDTLGHTLSLLTLKSQLVGRLIDNYPDRARVEIKEMERTSRAALNQVRELVSDMRTLSLKDELMQIEILLQHADIEFKLESEPHYSLLPPLIENMMSDCLREAVTNLVKHSQATICCIHMKISKGSLTAIIEDNGVGLRTQYEQGNGMKGMIERLSVIGGDVSWNSNQQAINNKLNRKSESRSNSGTKVVIHIPLVQQGKELTS